jgi:molecular chaperone DnaK (HSP70)
MTPERHLCALGVDYGTSCSLAAVAGRGGGPELVPVNERPRATAAHSLPGYLYFPSRGRVVVGEVARRLYPLKPHKVVRSVKRDLEGSWTVGRTTYAATDLVTLTLRELLGAVRAHAGRAADGLVLTVPSTFGQAQRRALIAAACAADDAIEEVTLLDEPLAAFIAFLHEARAGRCPAPPRSGRVMVFDMGGGTTDISVLSVRSAEAGGSSARVLGVSSDTRLGGDDFDHALAGHLASMWMDGSAVDSGLLTDSERRWTGGRLLVAAERAKVALCSGRRSVHVGIEDLPSGPLSVDVDGRVLAEVTDVLAMRVRETVRQGLDVAGIGPGGVDLAVLAGGMSRCGLVRDAVAGVLGRPPVLLDDPVTAVVRGACLHHQALRGDATQVLLEPLRPVLTETMSLRLAGGRFMTLLESGTELPAERTVRGCLLTPHTGCASVRVPLYASGEGEGSPRRVRATLTLSAGADLPGGQPVGLEVAADTNKIVTVRAFLEHGRSSSLPLAVRGL